MALERTFQELSDRLRRLRDSLLALQLTIREDLPPQGGVALVDQFGDAVDDSLGWLEESLLAAVEAYHAVEHPSDMDRARRALGNCQEQFHRVERGHGRFSRAFTLPEPIEVENVAADLRDGVLTITIPKAADRGMRHVNVT